MLPYWMVQDLFIIWTVRDSADLWNFISTESNTLVCDYPNAFDMKNLGFFCFARNKCRDDVQLCLTPAPPPQTRAITVFALLPI